MCITPETVKEIVNEALDRRDKQWEENRKTREQSFMNKIVETVLEKLTNDMPKSIDANILNSDTFLSVRRMVGKWERLEKWLFGSIVGIVVGAFTLGIWTNSLQNSISSQKGTIEDLQSEMKDNNLYHVQVGKDITALNTKMDNMTKQGDIIIGILKDNK